MSETSEVTAIIQHAARSLETIREAASDTRMEIEKYRSTLQEIAEITSDPKVERLARAALED